MPSVESTRTRRAVKAAGLVGAGLVTGVLVGAVGVVAWWAYRPWEAKR